MANIPDKAVEAAAQAMLAVGNHIGGWDALPTFMQDNYTRDARAALEAAAPHLMAEVWDEAIEAASSEEREQWRRDDEFAVVRPTLKGGLPDRVDQYSDARRNTLEQAEHDRDMWLSRGEKAFIVTKRWSVHRG